MLVLSGQFPNPRDPVRGTYVLEQMRALRKLGVEMAVISATPWAPRVLRFLGRVRKYLVIPQKTDVDGFEVRYPGVPALPGGRLFFLSGFFLYLRCRPIVREFLVHPGIDLIHAHTIMPEGFAAVMLGKAFGVPVVCTVHGSDIKLYPSKNRATRRATQWALRRVDRLIAVSQDLRTAVFNLVGVRQICIAKNGADRDRFRSISKDEARSRLELPSDKKIILFVGNLFAVKGIEFLLAAISQVKRRDLRLYLLGDGHLREELAATARQLEVDDLCLFMGQRPHDEVPVWLSAADCLVLPSLSEGFPTILVEAMMSGTPVVATAVGGVPEIVEHRKTGLLVPPRDPPALARAISELLTDQALAGTITENAKLYVTANLTWEKNARETLAVYREAVNNSVDR